MIRAKTEGDLPWGVEMERLCNLKPAERNARTHSKKQIRWIASSIREFGFLNPVIVDGTNMIPPDQALRSAGQRHQDRDHRADP